MIWQNVSRCRWMLPMLTLAYREKLFYVNMNNNECCLWLPICTAISNAFHQYIHTICAASKWSSGNTIKYCECQLMCGGYCAVNTANIDITLSVKGFTQRWWCLWRPQHRTWSKWRDRGKIRRTNWRIKKRPLHYHANALAPSFFLSLFSTRVRRVCMIWIFASTYKAHQNIHHTLTACIYWLFAQVTQTSHPCHGIIIIYNSIIMKYVYIWCTESINTL